MPYEFIEGYTMADVAFEARGKTIEEMCESAAKALTNSMVSDLKAIESKKTINVKVESKDEERLLHDFLQEIIFYKDAENLIFNEYSIRVVKSEKGYILEAEMKGEDINMEKHDLVVDVKAVSWHRYKVEKKEEWKAFVILDV
jgi:SHS2 domain-containing protein